MGWKRWALGAAAALLLGACEGNPNVVVSGQDHGGVLRQVAITLHDGRVITCIEDSSSVYGGTSVALSCDWGG
jgi:hypothetical protein